MTARDHGADDLVDELARSIPAPRLDAARTERVRSELLAAAGTMTPLPARSSGLRWIAIAAAPLAIAAAVALWLLAGRAERPPAALSQASMELSADADLVRVGAPPDEIIQLRNGTVTFEVTPLRAGQRFRVLTADAEIEVRGTRFVVAADHGVLRSVEVIRGVVELRPRTGSSLTLADGERWPVPPDRVLTGASLPSPPQPPSPPSPPSPPAPQAPPPAPPRQTRPSIKPPAIRQEPPSSSVAESPPRAAPEPPAPLAPGEAEFREGWEALRRGDAADAARAFAQSSVAGRGRAIAEDARFWEGVALARAGEPARAIAALRGFLGAFPRSSRAGEASARLGWLLLDAGETDEAARRFEAAVDDAVPAVRQSARSGLARIHAKP